MRQFKAFILLFLILKGTVGFGLPTTTSQESCCSEASIEVVQGMDMNNVNICDQEEEEKGCCDLNCHCLCCLHLLKHESHTLLQIIPVILVTKSQPVYNFNYHHLCAETIWQPPRLI